MPEPWLLAIPPGLEDMIGGGWAFIDNDTIGGNGSIDNIHWKLWAYSISTRQRWVLDERGASNFYGGGGKWCAYLADPSGLISFDSDGMERTDLVARGMSPNGEALYSTHENNELFVGSMKNGLSPIASGTVLSTMIGVDDVVLWANSAGVLGSDPEAPPVCPYSGGEGARFTSGSVAGNRALCQWDRGTNALVVYPWQATPPELTGYKLSVGVDEHHDIGYHHSGNYLIATGVNLGETQIRIYELNLVNQEFRLNGGGWQDLVPTRLDTAQITIPTFIFNHDVTLAVFKDLDGDSGSPAEILVNQQDQMVARPYFMAEDTMDGETQGELLGIYSEAVDPSYVVDLANQFETRVLLGHDSVSDWDLPQLPPWSIPAIELYPSEQETAAQSAERWHRQIQSLLNQWPGDVGVIPAFYCMGGAPPDELFPVSHIIEGLHHLQDIVNTSHRIKVIAPFAFDRANGIVAHDELMDAWKNLVSACPRLAMLTPVGEPVPPEPGPGPGPGPGPEPIPPNPEPGPEPEPMPTLPFKCFLIAGHNSKIPAVEPGSHHLDLDYSVQETGPYQQVEVKASEEAGHVLARYVEDGWYLRLDTVLLMERKYDAALQLYDPNKPDLDSGWQRFKIYGSLLIGEGPDVNGIRGAAYTFTMVDSDKKPLFN
jgi:hypothetical protein